MSSKSIAFLSLLANAGLGLALVMLLVNRPAPPSGGPEPAVKSQPIQTNVVPAPERVVIPAGTPAPKPVRKFDWRMVESADYREYIANLRSIGCPEETIRDIIVADVNKLFESRRREITASTNKFSYWKAGNIFGGAMDPARIEKLQALNKEKHDLLKELLGVDVADQPNLFANFNPFETMLDFLPAEKQNQLIDIYTKYQAKLMKMVGNGAPDAEDRKAMLKVQQDMEAELAGLLGPEDYRQYQLRMSQTAMTMRMQLASFDPSQTEFDKIFDIRKKLEDEFGMMGMGAMSQEEKDKYKQAQNDAKEQVKALLGEERYADYERAQDWNYQAIYKTTERYGLSKDVAVKVYDMKKAAEDAAKKIRKDTSLTKEQRDAALRDIRNQTELAIGGAMGEKAWNSYQDSANWLDRIIRK